MPTILHADWSNRPRTAFRRWTQAVHQVAAIQVGHHRFLACPYRFLAAKRQSKAGLSSGHSHYRTAFESFAPDISEQPDPNLTDLFDTRNHGNQCLSKLPTHTERGCHTHARIYNARQRDKSPDSPATPSRTAKQTLLLHRHKVWGGLPLPCMQRVVSVEVYAFGGVLKGSVTRLRFYSKLDNQV